MYDVTDAECRYYGMCERAYEQGCHGEYMTCWSYEPMLNMHELSNELKKIADMCSERAHYGYEHISNGLAHDYYGDVLHKARSCILKVCEDYMQEQ